MILVPSLSDKSRIAAAGAPPAPVLSPPASAARCCAACVARRAASALRLHCRSWSASAILKSLAASRLRKPSPRNAWRPDASSSTRITK